MVSPINMLSDRGIRAGEGESVKPLISKAKLFELYTTAFVEGIRLNTRLSELVEGTPEYDAVKRASAQVRDRATAFSMVAAQNGWKQDMDHHVRAQLKYVHTTELRREPHVIDEVVSRTTEKLERIYLSEPSRWSKKAQELAERTASGEADAPVASTPSEKSQQITLGGQISLPARGPEMTIGMAGDLAKTVNGMAVRPNLTAPGVGHDMLDLVNVGVTTGIAAAAQMALSLVLRGHNFFAPATPAHYQHYQGHYFVTPNGK